MGCKMKKVLIIMLAMPILLASCTSTTETPASVKPEAVAKAFFETLSSDDIDTCLTLVSDDILFCQEPPGFRIQGKDLFEDLLRRRMAWHDHYFIVIPFSVDDNKVTVSVKVSGDDFQILGMDYMNATEELIISDGKIKSLLTIPSTEDWARLNELSAGGIGIHFAYVEQGIKVNKLVVGSPASEAGVRPGDIITAVDGHNINPAVMREGEVILRISGPVGSKLCLTLIHEGMTTPVDVEVTRVDLEALRSQ